MKAQALPEKAAELCADSQFLCPSFEVLPFSLSFSLFLSLVAGSDPSSSPPDYCVTPAYPLEGLDSDWHKIKVRGDVIGYNCATSPFLVSLF